MIRRQMYQPRILLFTLLLIGQRVVLAQDLSVAFLGSEEWITRYEPLEFILSRPIAAKEQLSVIVGTTDVTGLCTMHGDTLRYRPRAVPLPRGSVNVSVFLVSPDGAWASVGSFTLNVLTATGLEKSLVTPSVTLANKGQIAEGHSPESSGPARSTFQELNGQLALKVDIERSGINVGVGANIMGVSFKQEALRFAEKGEEAAKIDLASYVIETRTGRTTVSAGHISHGRSRHLLNSFSSRGISATTAIGTFADLSGSVLNGTNIVGWDNFLGLENADHRLYSGTLGLEILPDNPGTIRFEGSYVHGSQLPLNHFNQAQVNDAEESSGGSGRLLLSDPGRNITVDAGFTIARFTNPVDPLLSQGFDVVPVEETTRQARYADVTWEVFRDAMVLGVLPARMNVVFRHERVDPLYRAVGANVRSDNLQNTYELHGGVGPLQMDLMHLRSEDNLAEIESVLKSKTRQTGANVALSPAASAGIMPPWLPTLSYGLNSTHQFGVSTPTNSEFTPDRVPDQVTTSHTAGIEWQGSSLRLGYRGTYTTQDNRQPGKENADAVNRTNGFNISFSPLTQVSLNLEGSLESSENTETGSIIRNRRVGANLLAPLVLGVTALLNASLSTSQPDDGSSSQRQALFSLETSYVFDLSSSFVFKWRGQAFVRYSWSEFETRDNVFNLDSQTRAWVVNTGISLNLF
jgi:hypothetical protein